MKTFYPVNRLKPSFEKVGLINSCVVKEMFGLKKEIMKRSSIDSLKIKSEKTKMFGQLMVTCVV